MQPNKLAREMLLSEREAHNGESDPISVPSAFWFPVYEGLFEHCPKMLDAVWFFMWLIARTTRESNGIGKVLGGIPISDDRPAGELGVSVKTLRRWRRIIVKGNYAVAVRTGHGFIYTLPKSKKSVKSAKRDFPKLPIPPEENAQNRHSDLPLRAVRVPETGRESAQSRHSNKTIQRQDKEEAVEENAARPPSSDLKNQDERFPKAWEEIGIEPCGILKFVLAWEEIWGDSIEGEPFSVVMERCIQRCQAEKIQVPRRFYSRKHWIEDHEEPEEIRSIAGLRGVAPEYQR